MKQIITITLLFFSTSGYAFKCVDDIPHCRVLAKNGDNDAQYQLAVEYATGKHLKKDTEKALTLLQRPADQGKVEAQFDLAYFYYDRGLRADKTQKLALSRHINTSGGNKPSLDGLNSIQEKTFGRNEDFDTAVKWLKKSIKKQHARSQNLLAFLYLSGRGVKKNPKKAFDLYQKAANQNLATSQYNLGVMYADGFGAIKDSKLAYIWFSIAQKNGYDKKNKVLKEINMSLKNLSAKQKSDAEKDIQELIEKFKSKSS